MSTDDVNPEWVEKAAAVLRDSRLVNVCGDGRGCRCEEAVEYSLVSAHDMLAAVLDVEEMARVDAETSRCSWSIPRDGHPYHEACLYKRERVDGGVSHGACWDMPYARAEALRAAILGGAA
jgi:hypothetical protein